jgi:uncharacterized protein (TIRG00374 family)
VTKLLLALKLAIAFGVLVVLAFSVNLSEFLRLILAIPRYTFFIGCAVILLQALLLALRWRDISNYFTRANTSLNSAFTSILISFFFSQGLPASVGGDVVRIWLLKERFPKVRVRDGIKAILVDRFWGFLALLFLACAGLGFLVVTQQDFSAWYVPFGIAAAGAVGVLVALVRWPRALLEAMSRAAQNMSPLLVRVVGSLIRLKDDLDHYNRRPSRFARTFVLSMAVHGLTLFLAVLFFVSVPTNLNWNSVALLPFLAAIPPALLVGYLPISIAGWGVREGAMVLSLGLVGVSIEEAVAVSLFIGLSVLLVSLLGGLLWLASAVRRSGHAAVSLKPEASSS